MTDQPRGSLVLAATPIGNSEDASARLRTLLTEADVVAAEDTRRLHGLATRLGIEVPGKVMSFHEHNEQERSEALLDVVAGGGLVVVVSDAGMPAVSDPGFRVVAAAVARGLHVTAAPGPSAVLTALALSGLPTDRFTFEGFAPRKDGERSRLFAELLQERRTMVFFESPHRVAATLRAMAEAFGGDRAAAVCRELTKTYEEIVRGPLLSLVERAEEDPFRGEIVIVLGGAPRAIARSVQDLADDVLARVAAGDRLKEAVATIAAAQGVSKRELYEASIEAKKAAPLPTGVPTK